VRIALLQVPYHLGREAEGMGLAPRAYAEAGLTAVEVVPVRREEPFTGELEAILAVNAALARAVEQAASAGRTPVVAGGNCSTALGTVAGMRRGACPQIGLVWLDAHGDFNTPATTPSGFLDGMPLAMTVGRACRDEVWGRLGGAPLPERDAAHVGGRDIDPGEEEGFASSDVLRVTGDRLAADGVPAAIPVLDELTRRVPAVHLHVDIDVIDPAFFPAVDFPTPGGLSSDEVLALAGELGARLPIRSLSVIAYDPAQPDPDARTLHGSMQLIRALCRLVAAGPAAAG
jgi:arginase